MVRQIITTSIESEFREKIRKSGLKINYLIRRGWLVCQGEPQLQNTVSEQREQINHMEININKLQSRLSQTISENEQLKNRMLEVEKNNEVKNENVPISD